MPSPRSWCPGWRSPPGCQPRSHTSTAPPASRRAASASATAARVELAKPGRAQAPHAQPRGAGDPSRQAAQRGRAAAQRAGSGRASAALPTLLCRHGALCCCGPRALASSSSLRRREIWMRTRRGTCVGARVRGSARSVAAGVGSTGFGIGQHARCGCPCSTETCSASRPRGPRTSSWPSWRSPSPARVAGAPGVSIGQGLGHALRAALRRARRPAGPHAARGGGPGRPRTALMARGAFFLKVTPCSALCKFTVYSRVTISFARGFLSPAMAAASYAEGSVHEKGYDPPAAERASRLRFRVSGLVPIPLALALQAASRLN